MRQLLASMNGLPGWVYATAVLALNVTSLLFDVVEAHRWLKGGREVLGLTRAATRTA